MTNSLDAEFADDMTTRRYLSAKIKPKFGVTREQKAMIRVRTEDGGNLSDMKDSLDGLDTELGPKNELLVILCTYMPLCAPVGLYKDKATVSSSNGGSTKPVVIQPDCRLIDLYMSVDGVAYEDTTFCYGESSNDDATAKAKALERCYSEYEEPLKKQVNEGAQGGKPWVTIFAKDAFRGEFFVFLPLMIEQGADTDSVMIDDASKDYAEGLLLAWSKLLGQVGEGKHTFELRIAPRCVISPVTGEGEGYHEELCVIDGCALQPPHPPP